MSVSFNFLKPDHINIVELDNYNMRVTIEPLRKGLGHTLGSSLRRTLLSFVPGCAITEAKFFGLTHEFIAKSGVYEDMLDILLNLGGICFKMEDKNFIELKLSKNGPCKILASDFPLPEGVSIINPNHVLANVDVYGNLEIGARVVKGQGFQEALSKYDFKKKKLIGWIQLDAFFNPIEKVSYKVEDSRIQCRDDLDKLIIFIKTNGTVSASEALKVSAKMLIDQLSIFLDLKKKLIEKKIIDKDEINSDLFKPIDSLDLTVRSTNCLKAEKIYYIGDLIQKSERDLLKIQHLGKKSLVEIKTLLQKKKLSLGTRNPAWVKMKSDYENKYFR